MISFLSKPKVRLILIISIVVIIGIAILGYFTKFDIANLISGGSSKYSYTIRPLPKVVNYYDKNTIALPRPPQPVKKQLQYINLDKSSWADVMMMTTLQGNVNRTAPSMYIIHDFMVEGIPGFNGPQYWFDKLDESYIGNEAFTKKQYTDEFKMLYDNMDSIEGIILYHPRLTDSTMSGHGHYDQIYSDIALLNLTLMMCGQYNSIALNSDQYYQFKDYLSDKGIDITKRLPIKGDTTSFMKKDSYGNYDSNRSDRAIYEKVYQYALSKFATTSNKKAMAHNAGFQAANFDYIVANKLFAYNRISTDLATDSEKELEKDILSVTDSSTPVISVWYLQKDEATFLPVIVKNGKYMSVTYETFNLSWTTGLPIVTIDTHEKEIKLDESKIYVAINNTEGDNNSYLNLKFPTFFDDKNRGKFPFSWAISPTLMELNPNIMKYMNDDWKDGDGLTIAEAGIDYVDAAPPPEYQDKYFQLSDEYMKRVNNGNMRVLYFDWVDPLPFAEKMKNLDSVLVGYGPTTGTASLSFNSNKNDFLFHGVPFIGQYYGFDKSLISAEFSAPNFVSLSFSGWSNTNDDIKNVVSKLDSRYQIVTEKQLANLYKQYNEKYYKNVTQVNFNTPMTKDEMGYLYTASNYKDIETYSDKYRFANSKNFFVYKFDLAKGVNNAKLDLIVNGDYSIELSNDNLKWYNVASGTLSSKSNVTVNIPKFMIKNSKPIYIRFGDRTESTESGVILYNLTLSTNLSKIKNTFTIETKYDSAYRISGGNTTENGRSGEFVYLVDFDSSIKSVDLSLLSEDNITVMVSKDGKKYSNIKISKNGETRNGLISGVNGKTYIKFKALKPISKVKFIPTPSPIGSVSFSPVNGVEDLKYDISLDETIVNDQTSDSSRKLSKIGGALAYRFVTQSDITNASLELNVTGLYKIEVSNDNEKFTVLYTSKVGDLDPGIRKLDVSRFAAGGKTLYVKISKSSNVNVGNVILKKIRLLSNKTQSYLLNKIQIENKVEAIILPGTDQESALIDVSRSTANDTYGLYVGSAGTWRNINAIKDGRIVYKLDFNKSNKDYWSGLGLDLDSTKLTSLSVNMDVGNSYKVEVSADGNLWKAVDDVVTKANAAGNRKMLSFSLTDQLNSGTINVAYIRFSRGTSWNGSDDGLWLTMNFNFNS